jgi:hypothetical protein
MKFFINIQSVAVAHSDGMAWSQLRLGDSYCLDVPQKYSAPFGDIKWSISDESVITVDKSSDRSQHCSMLLIKGNKPGKCRLILVPEESGDGVQQYSKLEPAQILNIEIIAQPVNAKHVRNIHRKIRARKVNFSRLSEYS